MVSMMRLFLQQEYDFLTTTPHAAQQTQIPHNPLSDYDEVAIKVNILKIISKKKTIKKIIIYCEIKVYKYALTVLRDNICGFI